jgi:hypothetical protein
MNSPDKKKMDRYHKDQLDSNLKKELEVFYDIVGMLVSSVTPKYASSCKTPKDYENVIFENWSNFSEVMPPFREVKWNLKRISKYVDLAGKKGYGKDTHTNEDLKTRDRCVSSLLWFGDVLAYSAGLIKEDLRARRLFGLDD